MGDDKDYQEFCESLKSGKKGELPVVPEEEKPTETPLMKYIQQKVREKKKKEREAKQKRKEAADWRWSKDSLEAVEEEGWGREHKRKRCVDCGSKKKVEEDPDNPGAYYCYRCWEAWDVAKPKKKKDKEEYGEEEEKPAKEEKSSRRKKREKA